MRPAELDCAAGELNAALAAHAAATDRVIAALEPLRALPRRPEGRPAPRCELLQSRAGEPAMQFAPSSHGPTDPAAANSVKPRPSEPAVAGSPFLQGNDD